MSSAVETPVPIAAVSAYPHQMRRPLRIILLAFAAALIAFVFVLPIVQSDRCTKAGGRYDRTTLTCHLPVKSYTLAP